MSQSLLDWAKERGLELRPVDPAIVAEYERQMRDETIPAIIEAMKANERRVRECRHQLLF